MSAATVEYGDPPTGMGRFATNPPWVGAARVGMERRRRGAIATARRWSCSMDALFLRLPTRCGCGFLDYHFGARTTRQPYPHTQHAAHFIRLGFLKVGKQT